MTPGSLRDFRSRHKVLTPADQFREIREGLHPSRNWEGRFVFCTHMRTVRIGLLGLGHVGSAVADALRGNGNHFAVRTGAVPVVTHVAVKHLHKPRRVTVDPDLLTDDTWRVVRDPSVDVIVEAIGGIEPAASYLTEALSRGKHVVTANKQLVSAKGSELTQLAAAVGRVFAYEASVGAALPVIRVFKSHLVGDRIDTVTAVINGTSNFILSQMELGRPYARALAEAQARGLAEPDPADDVTGRDAAAKLAILIRLAFDAAATAQRIMHRGIDSVTPADIARAKSDGRRIRLLAIARRLNGVIAAGVFPASLPHDHPLAQLDDEENGLLVRSDLAGELFIRGKGAGGVPTSSAILGDLASTVSVLPDQTPAVLRDVEIVPLLSLEREQALSLAEAEGQ
jgi:homoserine dehydrogenase